MGYGKKGKSEGGQGGKVGHSNMSHRDPTEWVKESSNVKRRQQSKEITKSVNTEHLEIEILYTLKNGVSAEQSDGLLDDFLETLVENKSTFGGSHNETNIDGVIDVTDSGLTIDEGIELLESFASKRADLIVKTRTKNITQHQ